MPFPSIQKALVGALFEKFGTGSTQLNPENLSGDELPAIQVTREGGYDQNFTDYGRVRVVVVAADEESAEELSEDVRDFLTQTRPIRGAGLLLDGAKTEVAPHRVFAIGEVTVQYHAIYVVESRRA